MALGALVGCDTDKPGAELPPPASATNHTWFPLQSGRHVYGSDAGADGTITCESCHPTTASSFTDISCNACHKHRAPAVARLHLGEADFDGGSQGCYACHPAGEKVAFHHVGIAPNESGSCAECHGEGNAFARLPRADGRPHLMVTGDCGGCHQKFDDWTGATGAENGRFDSTRDWVLTGYVPTFAGTQMTRLQPLAQSLHMPMNHDAIDAGVIAQCALCHPGVDPDGGSGSYFPGELHSSLANLGLPQPTQCIACHRTSEPEGFVGPMVTSRSPQGPAMRHEAVAWDGGAPTTTRLTPTECAVCHASPSRISNLWSVALPDGGAPAYHAPLTASSLPQPGSCLDCHANSRPVALLTSVNATLPTGLTFDHSLPEALGECTACHASTSSWVGGTFHRGQPVPSTCLPCHEQRRPTSTTGWQSTTYARSPFDYGTSDAGITHGAGDDCVACHATSTTTWVGGVFVHGPGTLSATTCAACHVSQRPLTPVQSFDHQLNGMGDCRACHQATVTAGRYVDYFNPATGTLPGGDWKGGREYPGDVLITSPTQFISITQYTLQRDAGFVFGMTSATSTFYNAMLHTSTAIPPELDAGSATTPNNASCWHCHTSTDGVVTSYLDGKYHDALDTYRATPDAGITPLPQPTARCIECHEPMRPGTIVMKAASNLVPMDHSIRFTSAVMLGGKSVNSVAEVDCSVCHADPGGVWTDGVFHARIGMGQPVDCISCHYPLMASASADVDGGTTYLMKHRSPQVPFQACDTCHTTALSKATMTPQAAAQWRTGVLHPKTTPQPTLCLDCHSPSEPATSTQGTVVWTFTAGGTTTNGGQWMNHAVAAVTSRDCAACHQADAKTAGSAWSKGTAFHTRVSAPGACAACHGTSNGKGTVIGTNNNLPATLVDTKTTTTSSASPGVKDQISHADLNVTSKDCGFCHSLTAGAATQDWHAASFHSKFTAAAPLVANGSTGRCSNCHLNVKPGPAYTQYDHSGITAATQDCASCHSYPGTSTTMPNWRGASAMPTFIPVGGFTIPVPPAATAGTTQAGIANLPHPANPASGCTTCHDTSAGGRHAFGYDHLSALINTKCNACHESGSDLVKTPWNNSTTEAGGAGDTRPHTILSLTTSYKGNAMTIAANKHFFPVDCAQCHVIPAGYGLVTTGAAYTTAWKFPHTESKMTNPSTCLMCHKNGVPN